MANETFRYLKQYYSSRLIYIYILCIVYLYNAIDINYDKFSFDQFTPYFFIFLKIYLFIVAAYR